MAKLFTNREIGGAIAFLAVVGVVAAAVLLTRRQADRLPAAVIEAEVCDSVQLRPFDPNTATYEELRSLGMSRYEAVSLLKFRAAGKVFRIAEDVALCYGISDSAFTALRPYIEIGEEFRIRPHHEADYPTRARTVRIAPEPFLIDTVSAAYLRAIGAFTKRQAEVFIRWRDRSGFRDMEEVRACYVVDDSVAAALEPYIRFAARDASPYDYPVELNRADTAALLRIVGIGEKSASAIIAYRTRLGGFHRVEQLAEVKGVTEQNYEKILQQIWCDSCEIQKIDINFAAPMRLKEHPYLEPRTLRRLLKQRQLKGGWSSTQEMIDDHILNHEEAARLRPYLVFGANTPNN